MTKQREKESAEVEARWAEFWNDHKNFDSPWARNILHNVSEFLPFVFKFEAVSDGLKELYTKSGARFTADFDWSRDWSEASECLAPTELDELPIFKLALALRAYAYYGLLLNADVFDVREFLELVELSFFPRQWGHDQETEQTIIAAFARLKLDHPERSKGLTPEELATLARVSRKSVMNLVAPGKRGVLQRDSNDLITFESATCWLLARSDFRPSVWQRQKDKSPRPRKSEPLSIKPLFVPVASDGNWFSPEDRSQGDSRYYVANGSAEQGLEVYWEALEFLTQATSPRWRYTDAAGRWRAKVAVRWERKEREEVEALASRVAKVAARKSNEMEGRT
jgi:hypothetical protein